MARLFSKDYHERSNSWYFNHAVIVLEEGDLWYWHSEDEDGNIRLRFFPTKEKRNYFSDWVEVLYEPAEAIVLHFHCSECGSEDSCRHYLSLLRYAYYYLSDDILKDELIQTCDGDALRGQSYELEDLHKAAFYLEGIYNPKQSKIRIYHDEFTPLALGAYAKYLNGINPDKLEFEGYDILDEYTKSFLKALEQLKVAYSAKNLFWSVNRSDFAQLFSLMEPLKGKLMIKESGEPLVFADSAYPISLRIEPAGKTRFRLSAVLVEELSVWFAGNPSWLLFRNKVYKSWLPFTDEVIDKIFSGNMLLNGKDLVYFRSIVSSRLAQNDIYLDFDRDIALPLIIDTKPQLILRIKALGEDILAEGALSFEQKYELPISVLRFQKPLVYTSYKDAEDGEKMWFLLPHQLWESLDSLLEHMPIPQTDLLEQKSQLLYHSEQFEELQKAVFQLSDEDWEIKIDEGLSDKFITKIRLEAELSLSRNEDIDWFSYQVSYRYKDLRFTHEELKKYFRSKEEFLHTVDGRLYFISNPQVFKEIDSLFEKGEGALDSVYRARILNLPYYQRLQEENPAIRILGDEFVQNMFRDLKERRLAKQPELPLYLQTVLRGYQKSGISWLMMLRHYGLNGILADEMGLGKTIQALALIASAPQDSVSMVICPKTLLYNWAAEIEKFHTNISYCIVEGPKALRQELLDNPNIRLYLIGYSMVLSELPKLKNMDFEWIVLDEAQNIKNVSTQRTSAIKKLKSRHRLALSGTPIENNLTELWSIMDFLMPGYLGTLNRFKQRFSNQEEEKEAYHILHRQISPFLLRRVKKDVLLELPDKQEQISWCRMNTIQEKLYLQILEDIHKKLMPRPGEELSYIHILAALTKLRQVCNHPHLANEDILPEPELSSKLELLVELVQDAIAGGHKVLVFSQFVQMLKIIRKAFDDLDVAYSYLDGQTKDRAEQVKNFEENEGIRLFLISLKTGGTGLNLTSADTVILYDPWWNPMVENQAIDRAHRIGQTKKVQVYKLITKASVEEKIVSLQQNKLALFNDIIEGGNTVLKSMDLEDLQELFSYQA